MKRLVIAIYNDGCSADTYCQDYECGHHHNDIQELKEEILEILNMNEHLPMPEYLDEIYVLENGRDAPVVAAHWLAGDDF